MARTQPNRRRTEHRIPFPPRTAPPGQLEPITPEKIAVAVERIVRRFDPVKVILFGSQARGGGGPHSDVDLLIVLDECPNKTRATVETFSELGDAPFPKDIVVTTPDEIARRGGLVGTVLRPALMEGQVLYARS